MCPRLQDNHNKIPCNILVLLRVSESHSSCLTLHPHGLYSGICNSPGQNIGVGICSLLQGIFPIQAQNLGLLHCRWILYQLSHQGNPRILKWVAYPFSSVSSQPRNRTGISCIAGGLFTSCTTRESLINYKLRVVQYIKGIVDVHSSMYWI